MWYPSGVGEPRNIPLPAAPDTYASKATCPTLFSDSADRDRSEVNVPPDGAESPLDTTFSKLNPLVVGDATRSPRVGHGHRQPLKATELASLSDAGANTPGHLSTL